MKRILIISSKAPYPLHSGGAIRTYQMIKSLSKIYTVDLLYITDDDKEETVLEMKKFCREVFHFPVKKIDYYINVFKGFISNTLPLQVNYFYFNKIQIWIDRNIQKYDGVFCNNIRTAEYVRGKKHIIKWMDFVDAISMNYEKARLKKSGIWRWLYEIDFVRCRRYEQMVLKDFSKCMIISDIDREYILSKSDGKKDIVVIGNYVDICEKRNEHLDNNYRLLFVGRMDYEPNVTAVNYFVKVVLPLIEQEIPEVVFYIVGIHPDIVVKRLAKDNKIIVTGFVEDVMEYMRECAIFVAPMCSGAGVQNKILQAMSLGTCVITTTTGREGIDITNEGLIVADKPDDMAKQIISLLHNQEKRREIGEKAMQYIEQNLSEEVIFSQVCSFVE
ncbi:glycosyltransferase [Butyricimonas sp.]|uniref:glycosyltransferase n=1 Tax=Butyricimonas sp. TaxID=1969738 RepID=UPI0025C458D6|nr:glycosyltransferase [Butyricimonas sp.]